MFVCLTTGKFLENCIVLCRVIKKQTNKQTKQKQKQKKQKHTFSSNLLVLRSSIPFLVHEDWGKDEGE